LECGGKRQRDAALARHEYMSQSAVVASLCRRTPHQLPLTDIVLVGSLSEMKLVVLGSGTSVPHPERASAAFWLETASGLLLLDCGAEAAHRMAQEGVDWPNLDVIWISHLHLDHCGGLASFLFGLKWAPQTEGRQKPLRIFGCQGIGNLLRAIDESNNYRLLEQGFPIELHEVSDGANFEMTPDLRAQTFSTPHTRESLAIRLTDSNGVSVVYSSDTGYSQELASFAHGADLLILECSFWRNQPTPKHLELVDAIRLAQLAEPRTLLLTHLYPEWDGIDLESKAGELWPGQTIAAHDGLRLEVGP
jgi:ribonuclease BN (tRNA processing enzyme)